MASHLSLMKVTVKPAHTQLALRHYLPPITQAASVVAQGKWLGKGWVCVHVCLCAECGGWTNNVIMQKRKQNPMFTSSCLRFPGKPLVIVLIMVLVCLEQKQRYCDVLMKHIILLIIILLILLLLPFLFTSSHLCCYGLWVFKAKSGEVCTPSSLSKTTW